MKRLPAGKSREEDLENLLQVAEGVENWLERKPSISADGTNYHRTLLEAIERVRRWDNGMRTVNCF